MNLLGVLAFPQSALWSDQGGDDGACTIRMPIGVAAQPGNFQTFAIQQHADRQSEHGHVARERLFGVGVLGQRGDADLFKEAPDACGRIAASGNGNDLEGVAAKFGLQGLQ